jgi:hypothetical protein
MATGEGSGSGIPGAGAPGDITDDIRGTLKSQFNVSKDQAAQIVVFMSTMLDTSTKRVAQSCAEKFREERKKEKESKKRKAEIPLEELTPIAREKQLRKRQRQEQKAIRAAERERARREGKVCLSWI